MTILTYNAAEKKVKTSKAEYNLYTGEDLHPLIVDILGFKEGYKSLQDLYTDLIDYKRDVESLFINQDDINVKTLHDNLATLFLCMTTPISNDEDALGRAKIMDMLMDLAEKEDDMTMIASRVLSDRIEEYEEGDSPKETLTQKEYDEQMKALGHILGGYISRVTGDFLSQLVERFKMDVVFETEHYKVYRSNSPSPFGIKKQYFTNKINFD